MTEVSDITEALHKEIDAVPEADLALLLRIVKSFREGTTDAYEQWLKEAVELGIREADAGNLVGHAEVKARWQARRAAQQ